MTCTTLQKDLWHNAPLYCHHVGVIDIFMNAVQSYPVSIHIEYTYQTKFGSFQNFETKFNQFQELESWVRYGGGTSWSNSGTAWQLQHYHCQHTHHRKCQPHPITTEEKVYLSGGICGRDWPITYLSDLPAPGGHPGPPVLSMSLLRITSVYTLYLFKGRYLITTNVCVH